MLGALSVKIPRPRYDALTASPLNMSFSSDYKLDKIARVIIREGESIVNVEHGLPYVPKAFSLLEFSPGKYTHIGGLSINSSTVALAGASTGAKESALIMIDPLTEGYFKKDMKGKPSVLIGDGNPGDHNYKVHNGYDTFKVFKTGTLTINAGLFAPGKTTGGTQILTETFNHGLGYVPLFGPFLGEVWWEFYLSTTRSFKERHTWSGSSVVYYTADTVEHSSNNYGYRCIKTHTSSSVSEPGTGASWETYWEINVPTNPWQPGVSYTVGDPIQAATGEPHPYRCILSHTSSSSSEPGVGGSWGTYWVRSPRGYGIKDIYFNELEDDKFSGIGGFEPANLAIIRLYATTTQIVLELERRCAPEEIIPMYPPIVISEYMPYHSLNVTVDYTIFYNRVDEEFNLLTS